jgi:hypothetical protein
LSAFIEVEKPMTLNTQAGRTFLNTSLFPAIFSSVFSHPVPAERNGESALPQFPEFSKSVQNNEASVLAGVYIPDLIALPIVQQPAGNAGYVSLRDDEITQFGMASRFGNVGLLAHNNLAGRFFSELAVGQEILLVYENGKIEDFVITQILEFQALQPNNPYSSFRDLSNDENLTTEQVFKKVYAGKRHLTFQTCIEANGLSTWGRLFVIAVPRPEYSGFNRSVPQ